ncbi:hypothetical protein ED733_005261 [Metarhizium rileyi]|uniref:Rhodopsin domain-containing protein n=1 Tax=Metarhizium rileyi (strain RCEF 4871) TaxID=1649241 RepID=A0A5C6G8S8_METRR|nr:hypothetical protein ED733_005261 [Metarhizium rileyi]
MTSLVPNVYAAIFIPVPASTLALVLRLKARRMTRMGMGRDDVFAIAAWVTSWLLATQSTSSYIASYGEKKVEYYMEKSSLILWTSEYLYAWSIFCAKIAVLCFYRRLFRFSSIRVPIILLIAACTIWIIIRTFFTTFHCIPIQAFWVRNIPNAKCITNVAAFYMGTDVTHCLMDFIILALPIWEVVRMKLPFGQKIAVVCLFATGAFVGVASIFQIIHSQQFKADSNELPYDLALSMAASFCYGRYSASTFLVLPLGLAMLLAASPVHVTSFDPGAPDNSAVQGETPEQALWSSSPPPRHRIAHWRPR